MSSSLAEAFAEQLVALQERLSAGMPRLGWKIGINVPEVQQKAGLSGPLIGWLDGARRYASGDTVVVPVGVRLHVEPELCVRLGRDVAPTDDAGAALAAVDAIAPALELVDYAKPASDLAGVVRGSMFHFGCVLGTWQPARADIAMASDVYLRVDGVASEPARVDLVPARLADLVLLAARLLAQGGQQLRAGDHLLSGSFTAKAPPLAAGQSAEAVLGELGAVRCRAAGPAT